MGIEADKNTLLGLTNTTKSASGEDLRVGHRVALAGKILRIHDSGFAIIAVDGDGPQPAILVHGKNLKSVKERGEADA